MRWATAWGEPHKAAGKEKGKERQEARDKRASESMARGGPPVGAASASEALGL